MKEVLHLHTVGVAYVDRVALRATDEVAGMVLYEHWGQLYQDRSTPLAVVRSIRRQQEMPLFCEELHRERTVDRANIEANPIKAKGFRMETRDAGNLNDQLDEIDSIQGELDSSERQTSAIRERLREAHRELRRIVNSTSRSADGG